MFSLSAKYYDKIYGFKDYAAETERLVALIEARLGIKTGRLLDVACGTGQHIQYLKQYFNVEGLDISEYLLDLAAERNPEVKFHVSDMLNFDLGQEYDVLTCLFSAIGYVKTLENLRRAARNMARHVRPGGIILVEPWFTPESWYPGTVHAILVDEEKLKIARMNTSFVEGRLSYFDMHYLVGTPEKTEHFVERHELGLFTNQEMTSSFQEAGFSVSYDETGLTGRGIYIGIRTT